MMTNDTPVPRRVRAIGYAEARVILDAALTEAAGMGVPASVAILDPSRELIAFGRQDGAPVLTAEVATAKAFTALSLRQSTADLAGPAGATGAFAGLAHGSTRPLITFAGGLPLFDGADVAGAVGASGGSLEQDELIARAALAAFEGLSR